jgi:hypothetical protein
VAISLFRAVAHQFRDLRRINSLKTMNVVSHLIEEQVLLHGLPITFYAGFQRLSNVAAQRRRYERLASVCQRVVRRASGSWWSTHPASGRPC